MKPEDPPPPLPAPLKSCVIVHYHMGDQRGRFFAAGFAFHFMRKDEHVKEDTECIHVIGDVISERGAVPQRIDRITEMILPIKYVTYLGWGPRIEFFGRYVQRNFVVCLPGADPAPEAMTRSQIESRLKELGHAIPA